MLDDVDFNSRAAALMPIKPKYVEKILSGEKKVEFRKTVFKKSVNAIIIYSSSPVQRVVAICDINLVSKQRPLTLWKKYRHVGGIQYSDYKEYYNDKEFGVAIELSNIRILAQPLVLSDIVNVKCVPQSFMYVDSMTISLIEEMNFSRRMD